MSRATPSLVAAAALMLGACTPGPDTPQGQGAAGPMELVLWHAYRGDERAALDETVDRFQTTHPGVHVRALAVPYDAFVDKVSMSVPKGNGPDVFIFGHDRLGDWASRGLVEPLGFLADERLVGRFERETLDALVYGGELYGLPLDFKCLALYYNPTLVPTPPATTDDLRSAGKAARGKDARVWGIAWELDSLYFHAPWLHGFGGSVYAPPPAEPDTLTLDSAEAAASVQFVRDLRERDGLIPPEVTSALVTTLFRSDQMAFVVSGPWFRGELSGFEHWAVAPLPTVSETNRPAAPFLGVEGLFMSRRSAHKAEAFELMQALTDDDAARTRFRKAGQLVANRAVYADPDTQKDTFAQAFRAQLAHTVALSNRPHMRRVWTPAKDALSAGIVHGEPAGAVWKKAVEEIARSAE